MKRLFLFLTILFLIQVTAPSQTIRDAKRDYIWLTGYSSNTTDLDFGGSRIDFNTHPPTVTYEYRDIDYGYTNDVICDLNGNLLLSTNNEKIVGSNFEIIENGDSLNPDESIWQDRLPQGNLFLPKPNGSDLYYLLHEEASFVNGEIDGNIAVVFTLYYSLIDMNQNEETVLEKNIPILQDTLAYGMLSATRHANGKDWWIIVPKYNSNVYFKFLLSENGISNYETQAIGDIVKSGISQAVFSPDGKYYIRTSGVETVQINIYAFNRCTGELSNYRDINFGFSFATGVSVSPNSKLLYFSSVEHLLQYELEESNVESSVDTVAIYDGFISFAPTRFFLSQLASDNKIYIITPGTTKAIHIIHNPNKRGIACDVEQHGILLPTFNGRTIPNNPNFRLGPVDGSPCDTLGIDNIPVANFRYDIDTLNGKQVYFTDLSYFEPGTWSWEFGDGGVSQDTCPIHNYAAAGIYEVCLSVSNDNGTSPYSTFCQDVEITDTTTSVINTSLENTINVFPNPAKDYLTIAFPDPIREATTWQLYNELGEEVRVLALAQGIQNHKISLEALPNGLYFYTLKTNDETLKSGRMIKIE